MLEAINLTYYQFLIYKTDDSSDLAPKYVFNLETIPEY